MHTNTSANRVAKETLVAELNSELKDAGIVVVVQQSGLNADETRTVRVVTHQANVGLRVGKNTIIKHAIKDTKLAGLEQFLEGPTALAYSKDPIAAAKVTVEYSKKNAKFKIIGAAMGDQILDANQTKALAALPSLDELRAKFLGLLQAPASKLVRLMQEPASQLVRVVSARSKQEG
jgi:large subunit ribosomal protein L10